MAENSRQYNKKSEFLRSHIASKRLTPRCHLVSLSRFRALESSWTSSSTADDSCKVNHLRSQQSTLMFGVGDTRWSQMNIFVSKIGHDLWRDCSYHSRNMLKLRSKLVLSQKFAVAYGSPNDYPSGRPRHQTARQLKSGPPFGGAQGDRMNIPSQRKGLGEAASNICEKRLRTFALWLKSVLASSSGWWFGFQGFFECPLLLGMSSSQLTNSYFSEE
jgi:hypothetical protein